MKEIIYFDKLMKTNRTTKNIFLSKLKEHYVEEPIKLSLINSKGDNFYFFKNAFQEYLDYFIKISDKAISYREIELKDYLNSSYLITEINSTLVAEGVHSTRKMVEDVISRKKKLEGIQKFINEERMISNMDDCIRYILAHCSKGSISEESIYFLYSLMTSGINENIIERGSYYRKEGVYIGYDEGSDPLLISKQMQTLVTFINSDELDWISKSFIVHYVFEDIHPYYDFNGRMGRLLQLWVLLQDDSINSFWRFIFLSEGIYTFKKQFDSIFTKQLPAKKTLVNVDVTFPATKILQIMILHTEKFLSMRKLLNHSLIEPSRHLKILIIDILCDSNFDEYKWYDIRFFKQKHYGYSNTVADRLLQEVKASGIFNIRNSKPTKFQLIIDK